MAGRAARIACRPTGCRPTGCSAETMPQASRTPETAATAGAANLYRAYTTGHTGSSRVPAERCGIKGLGPRDASAARAPYKLREAEPAPRGNRGPRGAVPVLLALAAALLARASPAWAHTGEGGFVLLLPTGYYLAGGTAAVAISFALVAWVPVEPLRRRFAARRYLFALPPLERVAVSACSFALLVALVAAGFIGNTDPLDNPLPLFVWTVWWVGLVAVQALLGNLWWGLNPWIAPAAFVTWILGRRGRPPPLAYPAALGLWPATLALLAFAWFELIDPAPADPTRLAVAVLLYSAWAIGGMVLFGRDAWLQSGEPFSIFFGLIARLSPLNLARRELALVPPGAQVLDLPALPFSGVAFVLLALSAVTFDGLSRTFWWLGWGGVNPLEFPGRSAVMGFMSFGLVATWALLLACYAAAIALGTRLAGPGRLPGAAVMGALVVSILPISLAYHLAHYLTTFLVNIQDAAVAASDPFEREWDLFGTAQDHVDTGMLTSFHSVRIIWNVEAAIIVLGHMLAVALAHLRAHAIWPTRAQALRGEAPLAVLMILYTLFGLWLLATPSAG